jgi:hypothetical protein
MQNLILCEAFYNQHPDVDTHYIRLDIARAILNKNVEELQKIQKAEVKREHYSNWLECRINRIVQCRVGSWYGLFDSEEDLTDFINDETEYLIRYDQCAITRTWCDCIEMAFQTDTSPVETYDFWISGHFLSAIINDDCSGLEENDKKLLDKFIEYAEKVTDRRSGHWSVDTDECDREWQKCEISNLVDNCYSLKWVFMDKKHR